MAAHVFVYPLLQIPALMPQSPHQHISAHPALQRHITHRIGQLGIGRVVAQGAPDLRARIPHQLLRINRPRRQLQTQPQQQAAP